MALALLGSQSAQANTPLTRAVVSSLRNQVRLLPGRKPARKAKLSDVLKPGDGIVTSRRSLAELRFNDGSLARMGEQAVFRFIPKTRSFRLSNGTVLMLIPPGQGRTQVRTPNVTAGIRGSALVIRYDQVTNTSTVIALTNSQISVTNSDQTQTQVLAAGQAVVTVDNEIVDSYDVDLQELYRTSPLLKDLELNNPDAVVRDEAIAQVREETLEGMRSQRQFAEGEGSDRTQDFRLSLSDMEAIIAEDGFGSVTESTRFPGRSIGVEERFDADEDVQRTVPPVIQPASAEPPVTTIGGEQPPIEEAVAPPFVDEPVGDNPVNDVDDLAGDNLVEDNLVEDNLVEDNLAGDDLAEDSLAGDDLANDVPEIDQLPIAEVDDFLELEGVPSAGDNTAALEPEMPGADLDLPTPIIDDPGIDIPLMDDSVADAPLDELPGGDDLPGGNDLAGDDILGNDIAGGETGMENEPISEVDSLPEMGDLPFLGEPGTAALEPEDSQDLHPAGDGIDSQIPDGIEAPDMEPALDPSAPSTGDVGITVDVTVEESTFEQEDGSVLQQTDATEAELELSQESDWGS